MFWSTSSWSYVQQNHSPVINIRVKTVRFLNPRSSGNFIGQKPIPRHGGAGQFSSQSIFLIVFSTVFLTMIIIIIETADYHCVYWQTKSWDHHQFPIELAQHHGGKTHIFWTHRSRSLRVLVRRRPYRKAHCEVSEARTAGLQCWDQRSPVTTGRRSMDTY